MEEKPLMRDRVLVGVGYFHLPGVYLGSVRAMDGNERVIVEHEYGMLHIYSPLQIRIDDNYYRDKIADGLLG